MTRPRLSSFKKLGKEANDENRRGTLVVEVSKAGTVVHYACDVPRCCRKNISSFLNAVRVVNESPIAFYEQIGSPTPTLSTFPFLSSLYRSFTNATSTL